MKEYTLNTKINQECIPVGCVPSSGGRGVCLGGVCRGGVFRGVAYLPPYGQTDACENITFPQLLLRTVKKNPKANEMFSKKVTKYPLANPKQHQTILQEHARLFESYHKICSNIDQTYPYLICNYDLYVFTCNCRDLHLEFI